MQLFELSKAWPEEETYSLTDQIRRSSRSACANIAEAWYKRLYEKHFVSKLSDANSEAAETIVWLDIASNCGYLQREKAEQFESGYREIIGGLVSMMDQSENWCAPSRVNENAAEYEALDSPFD
jgi:four helix bundle protein